MRHKPISNVLSPFAREHHVCLISAYGVCMADNQHRLRRAQRG